VENAGGGGQPRDALRAGTAEREQVVQRLNRAFSEGRLELGELEERVAQVYAAKTIGELRPLTADLPPETGGPAVTAPAAVQPSRPATVQDLKQAALDLATSRINARLERDRDRLARRQQRYLRQHERRDLAHRLTGGQAVAAWVTVSLVTFVIWLISAATGGGTDPWFLWVVGPWGALLLARYLTTRRPNRPGPSG